MAWMRLTAGGRTLCAAALGVGLDGVEVPLLDEEVACRDRAAGGVGFGGGHGFLELHDALHGGVARRGGLVGDGDEEGQAPLHYLDAVIGGAADAKGPAAHLDDFLDVGDLRDAELFGQLGADLGGVAVDGLAAADDDVKGGGVSDGAGEDVGGREGVAGGGAAVGYEGDAVGAAIERVAKERRRPAAGPMVRTVTLPP